LCGSSECTASRWRHEVVGYISSKKGGKGKGSLKQSRQEEVADAREEGSGLRAGQRAVRVLWCRGGVLNIKCGRCKPSRRARRVLVAPVISGVAVVGKAVVASVAGVRRRGRVGQR